MPRARLSLSLATVCLCLSVAAAAYAQNNLAVYDGCGMEGDARSPAVQALNRLKNRYNPPKQEQIDPAITLKAMLAPGSDTGRWKVKQGAEIIGYVSDVKVGGIESTIRVLLGVENHITVVAVVAGSGVFGLDRDAGCSSDGPGSASFTVSILR